MRKTTCQAAVVVVDADAETGTMGVAVNAAVVVADVVVVDEAVWVKRRGQLHHQRPPD